MIDVIFLPSELGDADLSQSQVVVLDVLRATSCMVTGLAQGAREIRLFDTLDGARAAKKAGGMAGPVILAGESGCLKPGDFDVGNSPGEFVTEKVGGATILHATTNGTRAAVKAAAGGARVMLAGSLLNAGATAEGLLAGLDGGHTLLLCAGTNGKNAVEDVIGAGAILFALLQATYRTDLPFTDNAWMAYHTFCAVKGRLAAALRLGAGGVNVMEAGLEDDIDFAGRLDVFGVVAKIEMGGGVLRVRKG